MDLSTLTWSITRSARLADTTASDSSTRERWQSTLTGGTWTCKALWDSTVIPDTDVGLQPGTAVTLLFYVGDSTKFYQFPAVVETLTPATDNQNGVVVFDLAGKINGAVVEPLT